MSFATLGICVFILVNITNRMNRNPDKGTDWFKVNTTFHIQKTKILFRELSRRLISVMYLIDQIHVNALSFEFFVRIST